MRGTTLRLFHVLKLPFSFCNKIRAEFESCNKAVKAMWNMKRKRLTKCKQIVKLYLYISISASFIYLYYIILFLKNLNFRTVLSFLSIKSLLLFCWMFFLSVLCRIDEIYICIFYIVKSTFLWWYFEASIEIYTHLFAFPVPAL